MFNLIANKYNLIANKKIPKQKDGTPKLEFRPFAFKTVSTAGSISLKSCDLSVICKVF